MHILLGRLCRVRRSAVISKQEGNGDGVLLRSCRMLMHLVTLQESCSCRRGSCSNSASFQTTSCLERVFPTNSFRTLACEWFTAKRNALWISLLFNLSQRPLKTGSNALISYSEERLIYRYACHLLLRRLHKQSPTLSLMFESKSQRPIRLSFRVAPCSEGIR